MNKTIKIASILFLAACSATGSSTREVNELEFLVGTWQVEGKDQFEAWELAADGQLNGLGYKTENGEQVVLERLAIKSLAGQLVYEATVADQNDGATIPFTLNAGVREWFSFENEAHDFPKKIMYRRAGRDELLVRVLGADGSGFSVKLLRQ